MRKPSKKIRNIRKVNIAAKQEAAVAVKEDNQDLLNQVEFEYQLCWKFMRPKIQE